jgi:hypothetical protein
MTVYSERGPPEACIFVASLPVYASVDDLTSAFEEFGQILKITLLNDEGTKPYAFVQYMVGWPPSLMDDRECLPHFDHRRRKRRPRKRLKALKEGIWEDEQSVLKEPGSIERSLLPSSLKT